MLLLLHCCTQALEQNYITFKALSMGAGSSQQQQSDASIAALGSSEAAAGMDISDDGSDEEQEDLGLGKQGLWVVSLFFLQHSLLRSITILSVASRQVTGDQLRRWERLTCKAMSWFSSSLCFTLVAGVF